MGLFALITRFLRREYKPQLAYVPIAPQRLERRRVLDAAGAGLALEAIPSAQPFVQTASAASTDDTGEQQEPSAAFPGGPIVMIRLRDAELFEDQSTLAVISIADDFPMAHQVTIDWGDGSSPTVINAGPNQRDVLVVHKFLDDPAGPGDGSFIITATVTNTSGETATTFNRILVKNVAPQIDSLTINSPINENSEATLTGTYSDVGTQDTHTLDIDWDGDGTYDQSVTVAGGKFSITHQFLDDNPTGTTSDTSNVNVRLRDDDGGEATRSAPLTVRNVAPVFTNVSLTSLVTENGTATLSGTYTDVGSQDTHTLDIDWDGDGTFDQTVAVSGGSFSVTHQFLDDNPSGTSDTFAVIVRLRDDDGGQVVKPVEITVSNANPVVVLNSLAAIDENGTAILSGTYSDPGTLDTHELDIDWDGDGTFDQTVAVTGGAFTVTRQFLDDNPTGTPSDEHDVHVRLRDDDGGSATASTKLTVRNVAPMVVLHPIATIKENGTAVLTGTYSDVGTQDTHELDIDWDGDGTFDETIAVAGGSFTVSHQFLDDNPTGTPSDTFNVHVRLRDDDGGEDTASVELTVENADPVVILNPIAAINENGTATLSGTYTDAGTLDTHELDIDWDGDGTFDETIAVVGGSFTVSHQFLDDNPTGTPSDTFNVNVRLRDDDGGAVTASRPLTVRNVNPIVTVSTPGSINENEIATLNGTISDVGTLDTFTLVVNWGDPASPNNLQVFELGTTALTKAANGIDWDPTTRQYSIDHQYFDDNPTASQSNIYSIQVAVTDDDGGAAFAQTSVGVRNVDPVLAVASDQTVNEGAVLDLTDGALGSFTDQGTLDTHTAKIDWGDGSVESQIMVNEANGSGTLSASHIFADDGMYTVTVTLTDDDGGSATSTFLVTVENVAPTLAGTDAPIEVDEGAFVTLESLGVGIQDPGFDNPNNPLMPGGSQETLGAISIDWGDGTGVQPLAIGVETDGGPNAPTTATLIAAAHVYADNGTYTVTVVISDDDGGLVTETFEIIVKNVDPLLFNVHVDNLVIKEGESINLSGMFSDAGFDNPNNPNGPSQENLRYSIDWGDNPDPDHEPEISDMLIVTPGSEGQATTGSFTAHHTYTDNDADNFYTITVKILDDDGGVSIAKEIRVQVLNVNPTLEFVDATDITTRGLATFTLRFDDPGTEPLTVHIDWGDGILDPYTFQPSATPITHTFEHYYDRPPNPTNPSAPITIRAYVTDDDYGIVGMDEPGISGEVSAQIKNPGIGAEPFRIDTTPRVPQLTFPVREVPLFVANNAGATFTAQQTFVLGGSSGEAPAASYRYFELRVIDPDGNESKGYLLPSNVLEDLPALFHGLPDNHYRIYLVNTETNVPRLVIDVFVRNGKMIDPGDDSEGTRDRPPADERKVEPAPMAPAESAPAASLPVEEQATFGDDQAFLTAPARFPLHRFSRWSAVAVGLTASSSAQNWAHRVDEALAKATAEQWRKLQGHNPPKPKKT
jgi:hypothetical protein